MCKYIFKTKFLELQCQIIDDEHPGENHTFLHSDVEQQYENADPPEPPNFPELKRKLKKNNRGRRHS